MAKKGAKVEVIGSIKLQIGAGVANPAPPIGPALGQHGVNIAEFCQKFNERTKDVEKGLPVGVSITVMSDRSYEFIVKSPPAAVLLRKASGVQKGSSTPNSVKVGKTVTRAQLEEIANMKMADLNANTIDDAVSIIAGTARSMGILVEN